ncbi:MAG: phosphate transporter inner rane subunit PstA, partial [Ilumatobacteraceae bacterium]|nr:phosphate transporter inner rane subunit PstA [Ilumatobacteraceae bacterium]
MSTTLIEQPAASAPEAMDLKRQRSWRSTKSQLMVGLMGLAFVIVVIPLVAVVFTLVSKGAGIVFRDFPAWFTDDIPIRSRAVGPGMGPAIIGTIVITVAASLLAIPLGILGAVYLHEYGKNSPSARVVRFLSNV